MIFRTSQLKNWIWFPLVQRELDEFVDRQNAHRIRKQADVALPTGGRPDQFYQNPAQYGGEECLIPVDMDEIDRLLAESDDGISKMSYVDADFEPLAEEAYKAIGSPCITVESAWPVFQKMANRLAVDNQADSP